MAPSAQEGPPPEGATERRARSPSSELQAIRKRRRTADTVSCLIGCPIMLAWVIFDIYVLIWLLDDLIRGLF
jgi:hypothetical protein